MYIHIHIYIYIYMYIHIYTHMYTYICVYVYIYTCVCTYIHTHICMYMCMYIDLVFFFCGRTFPYLSTKHSLFHEYNNQTSWLILNLQSNLCFKKPANKSNSSSWRKPIWFSHLNIMRHSYGIKFFTLFGLSFTLIVNNKLVKP